MTPRRICYDLEGDGAVEAGDVLRTARGRCRLVVTSRRVRSRVARSRWMLEVVPVDEPAPGARVLSLRWHPRSPKGRGR